MSRIDTTLKVAGVMSEAKGIHLDGKSAIS